MIIGPNTKAYLGSTSITSIYIGTAQVLTTDFVMTVATTGADEAFTIPCQDVGVFDAVVDWGDGSTSAITTFNDADLSHTYAAAGDHQIRISGTFPNIYFDTLDRLKVKSVENLGVMGWLRLDNAFFGCSNMTSFVAGNTDTSGVTNMYRMFLFCSNLATIDLVGIDTSLVTNMRSMFNSCASVTTLDVTGFNTSNVTTIYRMFKDCTNLTFVDMTGFDTSNVNSMGELLLNCTSLTDAPGVENFNIETLDTIYRLNSFAQGATLPTARYDALLINWNAQNPFDGLSPDFGSSTYSAASAAARANLISTDGWTIADSGTADLVMTVATTGAGETFTLPAQDADVFSATIYWGDGQSDPITAFDDADLTHTYAAAGDHVVSITGDFPNIYFNNGGDTAKVKSVENLGVMGWTQLDDAFHGCLNMTSFVAGNTDTSLVTTMQNMFRECSSLTTLDVSSFDTSIVTDMSLMFFNNISVTALDVSNFDTSLVTTMQHMFRECSSLTTLDVSSFDTSIVADMSLMFFNNISVTALDVSNFDTSLVTTMQQMFRGCSSLTTLDVSSFDTSIVTDMSSMFIFCDDLTTLDVTGFNTSLVETMSFMFRGCGNLTALDVSNFDTSLVTTMRHMFRECSILTTLDVSSFDTSIVTDMSLMFFNNNILTDIIGVEDFDIEALNDVGSLANFANGVALSPARYDALLINWDAQDPLDGMSPNFGSSTYTGGGTAAAARANLISTDGWTIIDGGTA
jgi:surface protein